MPGSQNIRHAAHVLEQGGVIAYPTEGVYGLGCLPDDVDAVIRILTIKQRDPDMGLVLIAADIEQLDDWIALPDEYPDLASSNERPVTWIVPATDRAPDLVAKLIRDFLLVGHGLFEQCLRILPILAQG